MTMDTKNGGRQPAMPQTYHTDGREAVDSAKMSVAFDATYIASNQPHYATQPTYWQGVAVGWLTPIEQHTDAQPFCAEMACLCHFDRERMERHFIGPITQGMMSIAEAIDRYHAEPGYMARKQREAREMEREAVLV
jgi:hypothetical protein